MSHDLNKILDRLKQVDIIRSRPAYLEALNFINKYAENDQQKAYLLGWFFKYKIDSDELPADDKSALIDTVKSRKLEAYYYLKIRPEFDEMRYFKFVIMLMGFVLLIIGALQSFEGRFTVGEDPKYGVPVIREGGFKIIAGIGLFGVGVYMICQTLKKKRFLKSFLNRREEIL